MSKFAEGVYPTEEEAVQAVRDLFTQGYDEKDILLITNDSKKEEIAQQLSVQVLNIDTIDFSSDGDESVMDKIKEVFSGGSDDRSLDDSVKERIYNNKENLQNGQIMVLAELTSPVDRDPTTDPNSRTGGSVDHSVPQVTDEYHKDTKGDIHIDNSDVGHRP
ncbi:Heat induced stress protein YflT [Alkalibacterium subtropicum]|uniref:Heat induced stress protein YflT n=1 Tax=Alkalibacterium subtropicum TaxID=753702 RepID=A0A1I1FPE3_9LACT|nr:general stress protein [Alkalibacterium subtropicum]SFC00886.1 Heat induced stress protein YflT [Alkalibacterium subtropicum]